MSGASAADGGGKHGNALNSTAQLWELGNFIGNYELLSRHGIVLGGLRQNVTVSMANDILRFKAVDEFLRVRVADLRRDQVLALIDNQDASLQEYEHREELLDFLIGRLHLRPPAPDGHGSGGAAGGPDNNKGNATTPSTSRSRSRSGSFGGGGSAGGGSGRSHSRSRSPRGVSPPRARPKKRTTLVLLSDQEVEERRTERLRTEAEAERRRARSIVGDGDDDGARTTGDRNQPVSEVSVRA